MKKASGSAYYLLFLLLLIWEVLLTFQGFDLVDTGMHLTAYRFIFESPYSVQYSMMFWLAEVCGAFWMKLFPAGGLYWLRIGWIVFINLAIFFYYRALRKILSRPEAVTGLTITTVFILRGGPEGLHYDIFTTFAYSAGIAALYFGLIKKNNGLLLLSGLIFGISVFFKLSNISALALFVLIPFYAILNRESFQNIVKKSSLWFAGFIAGMATVLLTIKMVGHYDLFMDNIRFISEMGADGQSSHGIKPMLISYLMGYFNAIVMVIIAGIAAFAFLKLWNKSGNSLIAKNQFLLLFILSGLTAVLAFQFQEAFWSKIRYLFLGLMIFLGIIETVNKGRKPEVRLLYLAGLTLLLIAPLGSDSSLEKSTWGMWILGPLVLTRLFSTLHFGRLNMTLSKEQSVFLKRSLMLILVFSAAVYAWRYPYFDVGPRMQKTTSIKHPKLKCIFTSEKRARVMDELILQGFLYIEDQPYLLAFHRIPMIHYLADKEPFLSTSWPSVYYDPETFTFKLREALQKRQSYPAIIRQKQNVGKNDWPSNPDPDYLNYPDSLSEWSDHGKILNEFIVRNRYNAVWENDMFQVLLTDKRYFEEK